jgi:hypothetical protein
MPDMPRMAEPVSEADPAKVSERPSGQATRAGDLSWTVPEGWKAFGGSGMFTAIFKTSGEKDADEGSVITLPGDAGGMRSNVERWIGQLGLQLDAGQVDAFMNRAEKLRAKGGFDVVLFDMNSLVTDAHASSMLVAVAKPGESSYFVKLMAPKASLADHKKNFKRFCESLMVGG